MSTRTAELIIYQDPEFIGEAGYIKDVKAVCVLNGVMVAFIIREWKNFFTRKVTYELSVPLFSLMNGRPYGNKMFDTYEEALEFGKDFVTKRFPELVAKDVE